MGALSNDRWSVDLQAMDVLRWMQDEAPDAYAQVLAEFPEMANPAWDGLWLDTDAMGVEVEYGSWLVDALEATGLVYWEEGEPWTADTPHADEEA